MRVQLAGETDFAGFRAQARALLARGVPPHEVQWATAADAVGDLFDDAGADAAVEPVAAVATAAPASALSVPASFLALCESAALHDDPQRFALLYRLLWRMAGEPALRHDPLDADLLLARRMAHAVQHEMHKMRAFVRFRPVPDDDAPDGVQHVAWFEPGHHVVEANAPWFQRRFAQMRWAILTARRCVAWDGNRLQLRPGARRDEAPPADAGEQLWLTYYQSIFNPARPKFAMMVREMPRRYWPNLPEAALIAPLAAQAAARSGAMLAQSPSMPKRRVVRLAPAPSGPVVTDAIPDLAALREALQACRLCPLGAGATQAVPGEGPLRPSLMLVGEQPGDQEDLRGRPFVGPAGELLDRCLAQAGIERSAVYLTNAVRHFKFELRGQRRIHKTPAQSEALACADWLEHEIALVQPQALVALGATAARTLLGRPVAVNRERGQWHARPDGRAVFVTWHPSALLRMAEHERAAMLPAFVDDLAAAAAGPAGTNSA